MYTLKETDLIKIKKINASKNEATFIIEPLIPGYGLTLGNALRRILLSSLNGSAITSVKIEGINHEFSTIPGVKEDIVEIILNLKGLRVKSFSQEPIKLKASKKGAGTFKAGDFEKNSQIEIIDNNYQIATLDKNAKIKLEVTIEQGRGYVPTERRKEEKLPLGTINIDSIFTPIKKVHYTIDPTRVGGMTNFDKLTLTITTDEAITPEKALETASKILIEHFELIHQTFQAKPAIDAKKKKQHKKQLKKKTKISKPKIKLAKKTKKIKPAKK